MPITAGILNLSQRILDRVFVCSIVNTKNECLFSEFMGNELDLGTKKLPKNRFVTLHFNSFPNHFISTCNRDFDWLGQ